jgi:RES domain
VPEFKSAYSYREYSNSVMHTNRFIWSEETKEFLETVKTTGRLRKIIVRKNSIYWRAQLGYDWQPEQIEENLTEEVPSPFSPDRMKPLVGRAKEGRANPKGIPYLYVADTREIAMAEVRPGLGSLISVAQFKIKKDLSIVDFTNDSKRKLIIYFGEPAPAEIEKAVWSDIDFAFSTPVNPSDDIAEYIPTQIITELFKNDGFNGLAYNSAFGPGHNLIFFDLDCAELINCNLFELRKIDFEFSQASNPYFIRVQP